MAHPVLALGLALVTASGCVWYLPALADVRAGADRPDSRRVRAAACLTGWTTVAAVAALLLLTASWWPPCAAAGAGAALTAGLWAHATVRRRREARETVRDWAALTQGPPPAPGPPRPRHLFAASTASAVLLAGAGRNWTAYTVPAALTALFLTLAAGWARAARRGATARR
ncbi:hypothetical protein J7I94_10750 [Streptomyces sp. ISL-12]|uniref:hypothetical protein n=1 Tax=Streptomyces sp. ISL-12 TaxID=2819177 RepID=UPI001BEBD9BC|nr:hypothetical protein [Streptomyces sp. ISL-12]MBT2411037.1 hypothetical protein [Streptomyces sp. ISL-12]